MAPDVFHPESKKSYFRASRRNELMEKVELDKRCPVLDG
jgi:hypothetical protein